MNIQHQGTDKKGQKEWEEQWNSMTEEERMVDLYGEQRGKKIHNRNQKAHQIMKEAKQLVEKRWAEEFPEDDLSDDKKPWGYYWFNSTPHY